MSYKVKEKLKMKQISKKQIEDVKATPNAIGGMTKSELDTELAIGIESLKNDRS